MAQPIFSYLVPLANSELEAIVDAADYPKIAPYRWSLNNRDLNVAYVYTSHENQTIYLHRLIMDAPDGVVVDHINHNPLDNRRVNLRLCSNSENTANKRKTSRPTSSHFKGVCWDTSRQKWMASISPEGVQRYLGRFNTELEAALAYDRAARETYGPYASTNFNIDGVTINIQNFFFQPPA